VCVRRGPALWRRASGYLTVAAVDGASVRMSGSAGDVWDLLPQPSNEPIAMTTLVATLTDRFDAHADAVEHDVVEVLDALEAIGCVVRIA